MKSEDNQNTLLTIKMYHFKHSLDPMFYCELTIQDIYRALRQVTPLRDRIYALNTVCQQHENNYKPKCICKNVLSTSYDHLLK